MALGIRNVVDVRYPDEVQRLAHPLSSHPAVAYYNTPLADLVSPWSEPVGTLEEMYVYILDRNPSRMSATLQRFAASGFFPTVVSCTLGKDRTGLVMALLLAIAGVSREDIVYDYMLSDALTRDLRASIAARAISEGVDERIVREVTSVTSSAIEETLDHLETTYRGADGYARHVGLSPGQIRTIQEALVRPP